MSLNKQRKLQLLAKLCSKKELMSCVQANAGSIRKLHRWIYNGCLCHNAIRDENNSNQTDSIDHVNEVESNLTIAIEQFQQTK